MVVNFKPGKTRNVCQLVTQATQKKKSLQLASGYTVYVSIKQSFSIFTTIKDCVKSSYPCFVHVEADCDYKINQTH